MKTIFSPRLNRLILMLLLGGFVIAFYNTAWVADDAFITFRVIDNWLGGYGLRWNIDERVQVFTHPLWMFLLSPIGWISGNLYFSALGLSAGLLVAFVLLAFRAMQGVRLGSALAIATLLWCKSFIDYSSSGLENPLTHVLLALFFITWISRHQGRLLWICLLAGLLYLNRPDAIVLVAPALLTCMTMEIRQAKSWSEKSIIARRIFIGFFLPIVWTVFSIIYYGSPVPNTAIAKVQNGLSLLQSAQQAWSSIAWVWEHDSLTLAVIAVGVLAGLRNTGQRPIAAGIIFWFVYLIYVGGDYMGGRFFSGALVFSILMLGATRLQPGYMIIWLIVLAASAPALSSTIFSPLEYEKKIISPSGIADERGFYYQPYGLRPVLRGGNKWMFFKPSFLKKKNFSSSEEKFFIRCNIGLLPYLAGPQAIFVDPLALAEPFLARVPARAGARVGHYERAFPDGFLQSRLTNENFLSDPAFKQLWSDVHLATQANLFAAERFAAIRRLNMDRKIYQPMHFDNNATGLPGLPVIDRSMFSCLGQQDWGTWSIRTKGSQLVLPPEPVSVIEVIESTR